MLALEHVAVRYSGRPVLRDVSFSIGPGEIVAYLGANGAGKTTTMKVVTGLREPDYGRVLFAGRDVAEDPLGYRRRLGYVPETAEVYPFLSGREYLLLAGRLRALPEADARRGGSTSCSSCSTSGSTGTRRSTRTPRGCGRRC